MDAVLAGYPWLPRLIDKARAAGAGTLGSYLRYPCPIDAACLHLLGLSADAFRELATAARSDSEVVDALMRRGISPSALETFDPLALNAALHGGGS